MDIAGGQDVVGDPIDGAVGGAREGAADGGQAKDDGEGRASCGRVERPGDPALGYADPGTDSVGCGERGIKSIEVLRSSLRPAVLDTSSSEAPERGRFGIGRSSCSHRSAGRFVPPGGETVLEDTPG